MADYSVTVKVEDAKLKALSASLLSQLKDVVAIAAHNIERRGKEKVPVDTGATRNSIQPEFRDNGLSARIGPSTWYAPFLEFGTRFRAARPFMLPALEAERASFIKAVQQIIDKA